MPVPDPTPAPPAPPAPVKKSNTLIIVICVVLGLMLLIVGSCVGTCIYIGKKAKEYTRESHKNPQIAALALAAAISPGIEVVSKDLEAGTIVLKNTKTGEILKLDARNFSENKISEVLENLGRGKGAGASVHAAAASNQAEPAASEPAATSSAPKVSVAQSAAQSSTLSKFPADFPIYSSGGAQSLEVTQNVFAGVSTSRQVFVTADSPSDVADFFGKKLTAAGYTVVASENGSDDNGPTVTSLLQKDGGKTSFNLTAHIEAGKTHVEVTNVVLKQ